jgi:hypothetical protein
MKFELPDHEEIKERIENLKPIVKPFFSKKRNGTSSTKSKTDLKVQLHTNSTTTSHSLLRTN